MLVRVTRVPVLSSIVALLLLYFSIGVSLADTFSDAQGYLLNAPSGTNFVQMGNGIAKGGVNYGSGGQGNCDTTKGTVCANDVVPSQYNQGSLQQFTGQYGGTNNAQNVQSAGYQQQANDKAAGAGGSGTTPSQWLDYSANQGAASRNLGTTIGSSASDNMTLINQGTDPSGQAGLLAGMFPGCTSTTDANGNLTQSCSGVVQCLGNSCHNPGTESNADFGSFAAATQIINGIHSGMVCAETGKPPSQANTCTPTQIQKIVGYQQDPSQPNCSTCQVPVYGPQDICQETGKPVQISCSGGAPQDLNGTVASNIPNGCQIYTPPPPVGQYPAQCTPTVFVGTVNQCSNYLGSGVGLSNNCCAMGAQSASALSLISLLALSDMIPQVQAIKAQLSSQVADALSPLTTAVENVGTDISNMAGQLEGGLSNMLSSGAVGAGLDTSAIGAGVGTEVEAGSELGATSGIGSITSSMSALVQSTMTNMIGQQATQYLAQAYQYFNVAMTIYTVASTIGKLATSCSPDELQLAVKQKNKVCVTMPEYCAVSGGLTCLQQTTKACCYGSMISRVLAQQIKAQLYPNAANGGFGAPDNPNCSGFSPAQLAQVDWTKVDLSEWTSTLQQTGYGLPQTSSQVNAIESGPTSVTAYYLGGAGATVDQQANIQTRANQLTANNVQEASRANATLTQPTCYTDPKGIPTYNGPPVPPTSVIVPTGTVQSDYGFDQVTSCTPTVAAHCLQLNLGKDAYRYVADSCTRIWTQLYNFNILRPDLIVSAQLTNVEWDDHIDIKVNGADVFTSPQYYTNAYFNRGATCDLNTEWRALVPPAAGEVAWNPPGVTVPGYVDLTSQFKHGGVVGTQTSLIVGGNGNGWAIIQVQYNDAPNQTPTNCIAPPSPT